MSDPVWPSPRHLVSLSPCLPVSFESFPLPPPPIRLSCSALPMFMQSADHFSATACSTSALLLRCLKSKGTYSSKASIRFLSSVFCLLFSVFCFLFSVFCPLFSVHCSRFSVRCSILRSLFSATFSLLSVLSLFYTRPTSLSSPSELAVHVVFTVPVSLCKLPPGCHLGYSLLATR